jgi:hypothetical protein
LIGATSVSRVRHLKGDAPLSFLALKSSSAEVRCGNRDETSFEIEIAPKKYRRNFSPFESLSD